MSVGPVDFHSNRSCRPGPAHHGMKSWSMAWYGELARRILLLPTPTPAGDEPLCLAKSSTALHFPSPPLWIPAFAGMTNWGPD